jgi:hypothetical protein
MFEVGRECKPEDGHTNGFIRSQLLKLLDKPVPFIFVVLGRPMVIQIIQYFDSTIKLIDETTKHASPPKRFDGVHQSRGEAIGV